MTGFAAGDTTAWTASVTTTATGSRLTPIVRLICAVSEGEEFATPRQLKQDAVGAGAEATEDDQRVDMRLDVLSQADKLEAQQRADEHVH